MKNKIISAIVCLLVVFTMYYFILPPINITNPGFWSFVFFNSIICSIIILIFNSQEDVVIIKQNVAVPNKKLSIFIGVLCIIPLIIMLVNLFYSPLISADAYYNRITVKDGDFASEIDLVDFENLALLDKASSENLGDKVMGQMTDLVSQYEVSSLYTQISSNGVIMRATPLEYASLIKYFTNKDQGVTGYITVDSVTGEANLVRLEEGMQYVPSAVLGKDLQRQLRFSYPTLNFGDTNFEIDDEGKPYWVTEVVSYKGVGLRKEVTGVIVLDPVDGSSKKYGVEDSPSWIDHVYDSDLVIEQLNDWGKYKNGFFNTIFGQKEVTQTTSGYNYLELNSDIYMYTGITSVASDASNIGFVLTNLRTKETHFYNVAGAEEESAMASAEGQVQNLGYKSTFPLLINLNGKPTYLVSLKDNAGLVKMYAFIDYTDYQKVEVNDASEGIEAAASKYLGGSIDQSDNEEVTITVDKITSGVIDGNTYYYIESDGTIYRALLKEFETVLPFLKVGTELTIVTTNDELKEIKEIKETD